MLYCYLETVLLCDGENTQETLPTPENSNISSSSLLWRRRKPEIVVSDGSIIFLTGRVENVNLNFLPIEHHLCIFISFRFCICIRICVQNVYLNFFSVKQNLGIKFNGTYALLDVVLNSWCHVDNSRLPEYNSTHQKTGKQYSAHHQSINQSINQSMIFKLFCKNLPFSCKSLPWLVRNLPQTRRTWTEISFNENIYLYCIL